MRAWPLLLLRLSITLATLALAVAATWWMWVHYELAPWTRDGRIRADIVAVAPDVSGFVVRVAVADNQAVRKGDPLFQLDTARYEIALQQALATVARDRAVLAQARREAKRNEKLGEVVSTEAREESQARLQEASANLQLALADVSRPHS